LTFFGKKMPIPYIAAGTGGINDQAVPAAAVKAVSASHDLLSRQKPSAGVRPFRRFRPLLTKSVVVLITLGAILSPIWLAPLVFVRIAGPSLWWRAAAFGNTQEKLLLAETARPLVLPKDPSISPLDAGRALALLQEEPGQQRRVGFGFVEQQAIGPAPLLPSEFPKTLFARTVRGADGKLIDVRSSSIRGPSSNGVLFYAAGGLSRDERRWLETVDASPRWELWRRYLRAPRVDYAGARFVLPFSDFASAWDLPVPRFAATKEMAYATVSRAALYRSRGEKALGDTALREIITFGFQMIDNASSLIEELIGETIIGIGQTALNNARALDGRPAGPEWEARGALAKAKENERHSVSAPVTPPVTPPARGPAELRHVIIASATDPNVSRGLRMESYHNLTMSPCTSVRELLMGPGADVREALPNARSTLVRYPSDGALLDLMDRTPSTVLRRGAEQAGMGGVVMDFARASSWILHNPRIAGCVSILAADFRFLPT
jgi:hypothetical protein